MLQKALGLHPDAFVPDMEDSVPADEKTNARQTVAAHVETLAKTGCLVIPRVNALDSGLMEDDLAAVVGPHIFGVSVGKIRSSQDIVRISAVLGRLERRAGLEQGAVRIIPWLETAMGVVHAYDIASTNPRVVAVAFGAEDLTNDMGIERTDDPAQLAYARNAIATAAVAAGVLALDTPYFQLRDLDGLKRECQLARRYGFRGKFAIHPEQIDTIGHAFSPTEAEVAQARRVVDAFREAEALGRGSLSLDGKVVDVPVVRRAQKLLDLAESMAPRKQE
jgi:citrate lyase subunit beta/citryl-CoA lyase